MLRGTALKKRSNVLRAETHRAETTFLSVSVGLGLAWVSVSHFPDGELHSERPGGCLRPTVSDLANAVPVLVSALESGFYRKSSPGTETKPPEWPGQRLRRFGARPER